MAESFTQDPAVQQASEQVAQDVPGLAADVKAKDLGKLLSDATGDYNQLSPLIPQVVEETKAGYKTTEFWLVIVYETLTQSGAIHLPGTWGKVIAGAAGIAAYLLSRGLAKNGVPYRRLVGIGS